MGIMSRDLTSSRAPFRAVIPKPHDLGLELHSPSHTTVKKPCTVLHASPQTFTPIWRESDPDSPSVRLTVIALEAKGAS
jgi:hypothetical protein